jgi:hypothetical protein
MITCCLDTGPPRSRNVDAVAAANQHGTFQSRRRQPTPASENRQFNLLRQVRLLPEVLVRFLFGALASCLVLAQGYGRRKEPAMSTKLLSAALVRPSSELERIRSKIEKRINLYRRKILELAAACGAIETEITRRSATLWF